ncbi:hypothetical protein HOLleu_29309 [Holothuria leucospilota]|uniref:Uncharacterized protein n=1 Tax=Holothuria leucospilota TaxID=206669 RepID=A0A9Q1BND4_HOLLE|nr:hypothetical protein HOLleu_29309 [Holothuria leucospilota]
MSRRVTEQAPFLHVLTRGTTQQRSALLKRIHNDLVICLCECALNILKGNVKLTPSEKLNLQRHRAKLRKLVDRKVSLSQKRKVFRQKGGGHCVRSMLLPIIKQLKL